jgi:ATP-binding cassette, subfamily B, bacterial MsbA
MKGFGTVIGYFFRNSNIPARSLYFPAMSSLPRTVRFLVNLLIPQRAVIFLACLIGAFSAFLNGIGVSLIVPVILMLWGQGDGSLALPGFLAHIVQLISGLIPEHGAAGLVVVVLTAILLCNIARFAHAALSQRVNFRVACELRHKVIDALLTAEMAYHDCQHAGEQFNRISPEVSYTAHAAGSAVLGLEKAMTAAVMLALLFYISWELTLLSLLALALIAGAHLILNSNIQEMGKRFYETSRGSYRLLVEALSGIRLIKSFNYEKKELAKLTQAFEENERTIFHYRLYLDAAGPLNDLLAVFALIAMAYFGRIFVTRENPALSAWLLTYLIILVRLLPELSDLHRIRTSLLHGWAGVSALLDFLELHEQQGRQRSGTIPFCGLKKGIAFENVSFSFHDRLDAAVEDVQFFIPRGGTVALVGESGSGKSTIGDLLAGFYRPDRGRILVDGTDLRDIDRQSWLAGLGIVSQDVFLFHETIYNNIAYARPGATTAEVEAALHGAHAMDFIKSLPEGLETVVGDRGVRLSGGERQRIAIARALLHNPEILILDEVMSALDPLSEQKVQETLRSLCTRRTVLLIAHRLSSLRDTDHVLVFQHGRIVESGSPPDLLKRGRYYRDLYAAYVRQSAS